MIDYFNEIDYIKAKKKKTFYLILFFAVMAVFLAFFFVMYFGVYFSLPYGSDKVIVVKIITYSVTVIYVIFCFVFLGVTYKRVNKFYIFLTNIKTGLKETSIATFLETDGELHEKDGVDCKALIFIEWNKYKKDYFERKVLVFYEKPFPEIPPKAEVKFITQGNFLVSYEITESAEAQEEKNENDNNGNR